MYLAAFFAPAALLVAISGGLYLMGIKGHVERETIYQTRDVTIDSSSKSLHSDITGLLATADVTSYSFEYVKVSGDTLYTRPTSTNHYIVRLNPDGVELIHASPNLQNRMVELHKGHGPTAFKTSRKPLPSAFYAWS
jgi:hypothetical protein